MLGKAFHQHSSQHQGATSMAAPAVHSMHTPGARQYPCTTMEKKPLRASCVISLMFLSDHHFFKMMIKLTDLFLLLSLLSCTTEVFAQAGNAQKSPEIMRTDFGPK